METKRLRHAPNGTKAAAAEKWIRRVFENGHQFTRTFLEEQDWLVVPIESGQHFDNKDAERLANAAAALGVTKLRAVLLEDLVGVGDDMEVDATEEGLLSFSREYAHFNFALLPEDYSFAVSCTTADYFLVAGPRSFVEIATGKKISQARSDFDTFADGDLWSDTDRARLLGVSARYRRSDPR